VPHELSVEELLAAGRELSRQPHAVRARVLARAKAAALSPAPRLVEAPAVRPQAAKAVLVRAAAFAATAAGLAGSAYALSGAWQPRQMAAPATSASGSRADAAPSSGLTSHRAAPDPVTATQPSVQPEPPRQPVPRAASEPRRSPKAAVHGSYEAELELLRSAHTAYAARDYSNALLLAGEHARRFANGALSEQREALRIRCLAGAGRAAEARRAVTAFARRFPRSVLLRRLEAEVGAPPN